MIKCISYFAKYIIEQTLMIQLTNNNPHICNMLTDINKHLAISKSPVMILVVTNLTLLYLYLSILG